MFFICDHVQIFNRLRVGLFFHRICLKNMVVHTFQEGWVNKKEMVK